MARTIAEIPKGSRITDHISLGVIAKFFPLERINSVLAATGRASKRQRDLPGHVVIYYVIALALYMQVSYREVLRCLLEGIRWLQGPNGHIKVTGKSGISQARKRVGSEPLQMIHDELVGPIALRGSKRTTKGAWYRTWRLVSLDGSTLDVADTKENELAFGRPKASRGQSGFPQIRLVSLVENGTHVLFGSRMARYDTGEITLTREVIGFLTKGMLCLADRNFFGYKLWKQAQETGADLLWRVKKNLKLPCLRRFRDGSYMSRIYASDKDRRHDKDGIDVRVIEYTLEGIPDAEPLYRLITTILTPKEAPARELAALYHDRWEIENAFDEFKTHLRGAKIVLRSKRPELVVQEFYGFMMAHFAIRGIMHEAALKANEDPDRLSYVHSVRVIRRKLISFAAFPPSGQGSFS
ncbi:MAG TPA: IS4 family transposase [Acidobacteriota bacterium]|nr:IS4 family transposase [Acidobacteriota bacterium]